MIERLTEGQRLARKNRRRQAAPAPGVVERKVATHDADHPQRSVAIFFGASQMRPASRPSAVRTRLRILVPGPLRLIAKLRQVRLVRVILSREPVNAGRMAVDHGTVIPSALTALKCSHE